MTLPRRLVIAAGLVLFGAARATSAAEPAAGAAPPANEPAQAHVTSAKRAAQQNLLPNSQELTPEPPSVERPRTRARPRVRVAAPPDEAPLWRLLREERYEELDTELARLRKAYPRWSAPARLLALRQEAEARLRITQAMARKDWQGVTALAQQHPAQFTCEQINFLWGLAEAHHALGQTQQAVAVYQRIIPACPHVAERIATLQKASAVLAPDEFADLLQREARAGGKNAEQQAQLDKIAYEHRLRRFLHAVEARDQARAIERLADIETGLRARRDAHNAALAGWVYFDAAQPEAAAPWFAAALTWDPALESARYGLALSHFRLDHLDDAEAALRQADADDPRNRALQGDIALARALKAYEGRDYQRSLEYLDQADALGKRGRDIVTLRAWSTYQLGDYAQAARIFTGLYRDQPDRDSAEGLAFSLSRSQRWDELAALAESRGGPLGDRWKTAIAQRYYDRKLFLAAEAAAPGRLTQLHNIAAASVALGAMVRDKSGEDGTSRLRLTAAPLAEGVAVFGGAHELRLRLSRVMLESRRPPADAMIGSFDAAGAYVAMPTTRLANGFEPYLSYRHQSWLTTYAGIGLTPSGAALSSAPVGNLGVLRQFDRGNWRAEIFSQPVRESILSYTGIVDPYTGHYWGRVRRSGALISGYAALTQRWNASGRIQAIRLEGHDVAANRGVAASLGLATDLRLGHFDYFSVGPDLSCEAYRRNLSHFTFGHGGYFSPERLVWLGVSTHFLTLEARQHIVKGDFSLGVFDKREAASPCFPTLGAALPHPACAYEASSARGLYYSAQLIGVRRLSDNLQLGGAIVLRRSPQYTDRSLMVFLRFVFGPRSSVMSSDLPEGLLQSVY